MNFQAKVLDTLKVKTDCLVLGIYDGALTPSAEVVDSACDNVISNLIKSLDFKPAVGKTLVVPAVTGVAASRLLLVGLGKQDALTSDKLKKALTSAAKSLLVTPSKTAVITFDDIDAGDISSDWIACQGAQLITHASYKYDTTKSEKAKPAPLKTVVFAASKESLKDVKGGMTRGQGIGIGMNYTRQLGNLPGNICTPAFLAKEARSLARNQPKLTVKILKEKDMRELKMGSLLSVSAGSDEEAHLIVMEYKGGAKTKKPHVLVGKGITFDTGGISLKPGNAMDEMKFDMCGAASVFGTMKAMIELQPSVNVVAVVAASENMPNGKATKPGDIVTSMSGQTIEVLNTDAEGRLVLCDALTYVERYKPETVIDIATLTGACIVALGKHVCGLYSNDDDFANELQSLSMDVCDKAWHMPLFDEYQQQLDSNFADIANIGGPAGGSVTAACFLSRFTKEYTWAHLDIAGVAHLSGAAKGATGRPVPLLTEYLLSKA
ncbi:leucyl aminopeptidase [Sessilibacter corallicola]|uniref:Probable cytosol aminopeptidase n=1 Tax=Sessilibacter corallicola TaxID=2904075 RepID=A0ABQ0AAT9_9GAMM